MASTTVDRKLTPKEAAEHIGVAEQTLAVWRTTNRYPDLVYLKVGRAVRYRLSDLDKWLERRQVGSLDG